MSTLHHRHPGGADLDAPVLLIGLAGWIDSGEGAVAAGNYLLDRPSEPVATFSAEELLDHRARRPILRIEDGLSKGLTWPQIELTAIQDDRGRDALVLHGAEPDHRWGAFAADVVALATELGVSMTVGLGAYPAAVPHTRPSRLSCTASTASLRNRHPFSRNSIEVPAGIAAVIEHAMHERGVPSIGLWAQVPHYLGQMPYPAASAALVSCLVDVAGLRFDTVALQERAIAARSRVDRLVEQNPSHVELLAELESSYDASISMDESALPSGDDLAADFEEFLREQD